MKLDLKNKWFDDSPVSVSLELDPKDDEGWHAFDLRLVAGGAGTPVAACKGSMTEKDVARLVDELSAASGEAAVTFEYGPLEPWFTVRGRTLSDDEVELWWMVDHGLAHGKGSTDSGAGVLIVVDKAALAEALAALR